MPYPIPCPQTAGKKKEPFLANFQEELVGEWENVNFPGHKVGGDTDPLSYNIMPLPETSPKAPDGYILKNFKFTERLRFNNCDPMTTLAIGAEAPNRGGLISQNCRAIFYEQQVKFAEGPAGPANPKGAQVVHVENGAWLWLPIYVQQDGPFPPNPDAQKVQDDLQQPSDVAIAKQIAIPHGNSVLALGSFDTIAERGGEGVCRSNPRIPGSPVIPDAASPYPTPAIPVLNGPPPPKGNLNAYKNYTTKKDTVADFQNPHPHLTQCPNAPLQHAVELIKPESFMHWKVTTLPLQNGTGHVTNIPFEERRSNVTAYTAEYWMLFKEKAKYLAYSQTIQMVLSIAQNGKQVKYVFPHVTCNTVTFVGPYDPCRKVKK